MQFTDMQNQCLWGWMREYTARSNNVENSFTCFCGIRRGAEKDGVFLDRKAGKAYILDTFSFCRIRRGAGDKGILFRQ